MPFPLKCFVSYAYDDKTQLNALKKAVPPGFEILTFPMMSSDPNFPVSGEIIPKILECDALIYLSTTQSSHSQWVAFERDYARRAGKLVYSFDSKSISKDEIEPVDLRIQAVFGENDKRAVNRLLGWMKKERNFIVHNPGPVRRIKELPLYLLDLYNQQEVALWLLDRQTAAMLDTIHSEFDDELLQELNDGQAPQPVEIIYARVDPDWEPPSDPDPEVRAIRGEYMRSHCIDYIDLVHPEHDKKLHWNRVDDLIVKLTSLALRRRNHREEDCDFD